MISHRKTFYSRWVLCGEHSVLRGGKALLWPLRCYALDIHFQNQVGDLKIELEDSVEPERKKQILKSLIFKASKLLNKTAQSLSGRLVITNSIPFGAGLGGSAALSAALAWLFHQKDWLRADEMFSFAVALEDTFHGQSSGMDVCVILQNRPLTYQKNRPPVFLKSHKLQSRPPFLFLSDSGQSKSTAQALTYVNKLFKTQPEAAKTIDRQMAQAVALALQAIYGKEGFDQESLADELKVTADARPESEATADRKDSIRVSKGQAIKESPIRKLRQSIELAEDCFQKWGLITEDLKRHIRDLKKAGALAAKPTGAGLGGFVLSLWDCPPPDSLKNFIPLTL